MINIKVFYTDPSGGTSKDKVITKIVGSKPIGSGFMLLSDERDLEYEVDSIEKARAIESEIKQTFPSMKVKLLLKGEEVNDFNQKLLVSLRENLRITVDDSEGGFTDPNGKNIVISFGKTEICKAYINVRHVIREYDG
jgi:hypothetical protein